MLAALLLAVVAVVVLLGASLLEPTVGFRRTLIGRRVLVNTKTGNVFVGYLYARRGPLLVLKDVELLEEGAEPVKVDGELVLERSAVDFVQTFLPTSKG